MLAIIAESFSEEDKNEYRSEVAFNGQTAVSGEKSWPRQDEIVAIKE